MLTLSLTSLFGVAMATTDKRRFAFTGAIRTLETVEKEVWEKAATGAANSAAVTDDAMERVAIAEAWTQTHCSLNQIQRRMAQTKREGKTKSLLRVAGATAGNIFANLEVAMEGEVVVEDGAPPRWICSKQMAN